MAEELVDRFAERRSLTAGFRPPITGARSLREGEAFVNIADAVRCIGRGDGTFIEYSLASDAGRVLPGNPIGDVLAGKLDAALLGRAGGVAQLGPDGKVPSAQLPDSSGLIAVDGGTY